MTSGRNHIAVCLREDFRSLITSPFKRTARAGTPEYPFASLVTPCELDDTPPTVYREDEAPAEPHAQRPTFGPAVTREHTTAPTSHFTEYRLGG